VLTAARRHVASFNIRHILSTWSRVLRATTDTVWTAYRIPECQCRYIQSAGRIQYRLNVDAAERLTSDCRQQCISGSGHRQRHRHVVDGRANSTSRPRTRRARSSFIDHLSYVHSALACCTRHVVTERARDTRGCSGASSANEPASFVTSTVFVDAEPSLQSPPRFGPAARLARASDNTSAERVPSETYRRWSVPGDNEVGGESTFTILFTIN